jgi:hypothetical protein
VGSNPTLPFTYEIAGSMRESESKTESVCLRVRPDSSPVGSALVNREQFGFRNNFATDSHDNNANGFGSRGLREINPDAPLYGAIQGTELEFTRIGSELLFVNLSPLLNLKFSFDLSCRQMEFLIGKLFDN